MGRCRRSCWTTAPTCGTPRPWWRRSWRSTAGPAALPRRMPPGAVAVIEVSNLKHPRQVTPLAWDIAAAVGEVLRFEGEVVVDWDPSYGWGYDHSYCLVFSAPRPNG